MMDYSNIKWNKEKYQEFIDNLIIKGEENYRKFQSGLALGDKRLLGVRSPYMQDIAKKIVKGDWQGFLEVCQATTYEETFIEGIVRGIVKVDKKTKQKLIYDFIDKIDNWGVCDSFCAALKCLRKDLDGNYEFVISLINENPWSTRVGLMILLDQYSKEEKYLDCINDRCLAIDTSHYYVSMAVAFLLSVCYVRFPERTLPILQSKKLDLPTQKRTIQKICDSFRVSDENKKLARLCR